jgi:hypothetical protein
MVLLASHPAAALEVIEPVLASDDSDVYDVQAACLQALGRTAEADRALARALQAAPDPANGLAMLIHRHCMSDRYDRDCQLATRLEVYYCYRSFDRELAAAAAEVQAELFDEPSDRAELKLITRGTATTSCSSPP